MLQVSKVCKLETDADAEAASRSHFPELHCHVHRGSDNLEHTKKFSVSVKVQNLHLRSRSLKDQASTSSGQLFSLIKLTCL